MKYEKEEVKKDVTDFTKKLNLIIGVFPTGSSGQQRTTDLLKMYDTNSSGQLHIDSLWKACHDNGIRWNPDDLRKVYEYANQEANDIINI